MKFILDIDLPECKEDVEDDFSSKSITPASKEKGDNDWEKMINNALINLDFFGKILKNCHKSL